MPEWTRVEDKSTGHQYTVARVNEDAHNVLDKPGADAFGRPLPAKPNINKGSGAKSRTNTKSGSTPEKKEAQ